MGAAPIVVCRHRHRDAQHRREDPRGDVRPSAAPDYLG